MYSFCESVYATGVSPWHIRKLTDAGQKLGGGIDTPSLCGTVKSGWDIQAPVADLLSYALNEVVCKACLKAYGRKRSP